MLLFKLLILAHLIADFPLQFTHVYNLKFKSVVGQLPHTLVCLAVMAIVGYPLLGLWTYWVFILLVALGHLLIDSLKIWVLDPLRGPDDLWMFLSDQLLHLLTISAVFLTSLPAVSFEGSLLQDLNQNGIVNSCIFFLLATFFGTYLLTSIKRTLLKVPRDELAYNRFSRYYGVVERGIVFALILWGGFSLVLIPLVFIARLPVASHYAKKFQYHRFLLSPADVVGSLLIAVACSIAAILSR